MLFGKVLDELVSLVLRVNHQRPSPGLIDDDAVLCGVIILWQFCDVPSLYLDWLSQELS